jgi:hypothetical protein
MVDSRWIAVHTMHASYEPRMFYHASYLARTMTPSEVETILLPRDPAGVHLCDIRRARHRDVTDVMGGQLCSPSPPYQRAVSTVVCGK